MLPGARFTDVQSFSIHVFCSLPSGCGLSFAGSGDLSLVLRRKGEEEADTGPSPSHSCPSPKQAQHCSYAVAVCEEVCVLRAVDLAPGPGDPVAVCCPCSGLVASFMESVPLMFGLCLFLLPSVFPSIPVFSKEPCLVMCLKEGGSVPRALLQA